MKSHITAAILCLSLTGLVAGASVTVAGAATTKTTTPADKTATTKDKPADGTDPWAARKAEHEARLKEMIGKRFDALDTNHDGVLSKDEFLAGAKSMRGPHGRDGRGHWREDGPRGRWGRGNWRRHDDFGPHGPGGPGRPDGPPHDPHKAPAPASQDAASSASSSSN